MTRSAYRCAAITTDYPQATTGWFSTGHQRLIEHLRARSGPKSQFVNFTRSRVKFTLRIRGDRHPLRVLRTLLTRARPHKASARQQIPCASAQITWQEHTAHIEYMRDFLALSATSS